MPVSQDMTKSIQLYDITESKEEGSIPFL